MEQKPRFMPRGNTKLVDGTILQPELSGLRLILAPCGELGKPDTAIHAVLDRKWPNVARNLKGWYAQHFDFKLGKISTTAVQSDVWVVHTLCFDKNGKLVPAAFESCMKTISAMALAEKASVHIPAVLLEEIPGLDELSSSLLLDKGIHCYFYLDPNLSKKPEEVAEEKTVSKIETKARDTKLPSKRVKVKIKSKKSAPKTSKSVVVSAPEPTVETQVEEPKPE